MRNKYNSIHDTAVSPAKAWGSKDHFEDRRLKKARRIWTKCVMTNASTEKRFRVNVFLSAVDRARGHITQQILILSSLAAKDITKHM